MCFGGSAPEAPLPVAPVAPPPPPKLKAASDALDPKQKATGSGTGKGLSTLRIDRSSGNLGGGAGSSGLQIPRG